MSAASRLQPQRLTRCLQHPLDHRGAVGRHRDHGIRRSLLVHAEIAHRHATCEAVVQLDVHAGALELEQLRPVPALQADSGVWSAFVATDLAPMFADEPWLDMPPNPDGQAQLLAPLKSIPPAEFELALQQLRPTTGLTAPGLASNALALTAASLDPKRFLLDVMNNDSLDLALRIEAAKALLPHFRAGFGHRQEPDGERLS